jgi:hypothetical protein
MSKDSGDFVFLEDLNSGNTRRTRAEAGSRVFQSDSPQCHDWDSMLAGVS